jgi:anti-sigma B factor antagonist
MAAAFEMAGEIDLENAVEFEVALRKWLTAGGPPILDMRAVTFMDTTGLNVLVRVREHYGQPLTLQGVTPTIARLLHLTGLDPLFTITP